MSNSTETKLLINSFLIGTPDAISALATIIVNKVGDSGFVRLSNTYRHRGTPLPFDSKGFETEWQRLDFYLANQQAVAEVLIHQAEADKENIINWINRVRAHHPSKLTHLTDEAMVIQLNNPDTAHSAYAPLASAFVCEAIEIVFNYHGNFINDTVAAFESAEYERKQAAVKAFISADNPTSSPIAATLAAFLGHKTFVKNADLLCGKSGQGTILRLSDKYDKLDFYTKYLLWIEQFIKNSAKQQGISATAWLERTRPHYPNHVRISVDDLRAVILKRDVSHNHYILIVGAVLYEVMAEVAAQFIEFSGVDYRTDIAC